jgi:hypothetical protein
MTRTLISRILVAGAIFGLPAAAGAATYAQDIGAPPACDVTVAPADSSGTISAKINGGDRVVCFQPGDYSHTGTLTVSASGSATAKRWMRLAGSATTHPVKLSTAQRATLRFLDVQGDHWIVHRLAFDHANSTAGRITIAGGARYVTFDSVLMERGANVSSMMSVDAADDFTIQNSVLRNTKKTPSKDLACISFGGTSENVHIVGNEIYNCAGDGVVVNKNSPVPGLVIEANDIYLTSEYHSSNGTACAENGIDLKAAGTSSNPVRVLGNRIWGFRKSNTSVHQPEGTSDYVLIQNNVIMDVPRGVSSPNGGSDHVSIIGNLFYRINSTYSGTEAHAIDLNKFASTEVYYNTIVDPTDFWLRLGGSDLDVRCNVIINGHDKTGTGGSGVTVMDNAYYNTAAYSTQSSSGEITRNTVAEAMHEPYAFNIKQWTGPEPFTIPNARPTLASPHYHGCYATPGERSGVGIDNAML